jgi:hypothetical protein
MGREPLSVVGGIVYPYRRIPLAKGNFSWPFGRLTLSSTGVVLAPRGVLARVVRPIEIAYVLLVVARPHRRARPRPGSRRRRRAPEALEAVPKMTPACRPDGSDGREGHPRVLTAASQATP